MPLLQLVPSRICLSCDVCCRFPEPDSFLRPYFTAGEIRQAVARGIDPARFSDPSGCQVTVVPHSSGEGYLCPAFDPATSHCRIYEDRPLDCQIYPLAVMWTADGSAVVLGWDTKCPFMRDAVPSEILTHARTLTATLEREDMLDTVASNPRLVGRFQEDVVVLNPLPKLTERMRGQFDVRSSTLSDHPEPRTSNLELRPLTPADHSRFEQALKSVETPLAHFSLAPHLIWNDLFRYSWTEIAGCLCLFAEYGDGVFMPLPPIPCDSRDGRDSSLASPAFRARLAPALAACFAMMRDRNGGSAVSRVENIPEEWVEELQTLGYRVKPKDPDYLYRTADLVALAGDNYKSQRAACNRFEREQQPSFAPFQESDRDGCAQLCREWMAQKQATGEDAVARQMLADSEAAHREALAHSWELGLTGHVVRADGRVRAYTFGYERSPSVFCVLLEVADRSLPGLAAWIFRERCRLAAEQGYEFINTMDDSGLPSLAQSKRAYHPVQLVPSYIVTGA
ncbi:MAG TPA: phosphatidylglycerol lysyltransferase domain-containing protein [Nitrospiraceae bacterium]